MKYLRSFKLFEEKYKDHLDKHVDIYDKLKSNGSVSMDDDGRFTHLPSPLFVEGLLKKYYKPNSKLLDIGCGIGGIIEISNEIGYESYGIEINKDLSKYHENLNVIYGDILEIDPKFLNQYDIIYLYRPIGDIDKSNDLFNIIYDNCKSGCEIIYISPHQFDSDTYMKFNILENGIKYESVDDVTRKYPVKSRYDYVVFEKNNKYKKVDIDKIVDKISFYLKDYNESEYIHNNYIVYKTYKIMDIDKIYQFTMDISKVLQLLKSNNIHLNERIDVTGSESSKIKNRSKFVGSISSTRPNVDIDNVINIIDEMGDSFLNIEFKINYIFDKQKNKYYFSINTLL